MNSLGKNLRLLVALGLILALGSVGELPHRHLEAPDGSELEPFEADRPGLARAAVADETICPACVLQRLLSQARGFEGAALEKPSPAGAIAGALDPLVVQPLPSAGSPRGPPPAA